MEEFYECNQRETDIVSYCEARSHIWRNENTLKAMNLWCRVTRLRRCASVESEKQMRMIPFFAVCVWVNFS